MTEYKVTSIITIEAVVSGTCCFVNTYKTQQCSAELFWMIMWEILTYEQVQKSMDFYFLKYQKNRSTVMLVGFLFRKRAGVSPVARIL